MAGGQSARSHRTVGVLSGAASLAENVDCSTGAGNLFNPLESTLARLSWYLLVVAKNIWISDAFSILLREVARLSQWLALGMPPETDLLWASRLLWLSYLQVLRDLAEFYLTGVKLMPVHYTEYTLPYQIV